MSSNSKISGIAPVDDSYWALYPYDPQASISKTGIATILPADITAYEAIKNVRREERRRLIAELKALANKHGYRIVSTIQLKDMDGDYPNDK